MYPHTGRIGQVEIQHWAETVTMTQWHVPFVDVLLGGTVLFGAVDGYG